MTAPESGPLQQGDVEGVRQDHEQVVMEEGDRGREAKEGICGSTPSRGMLGMLSVYGFSA